MSLLRYRDRIGSAISGGNYFGWDNDFGWDNEFGSDNGSAAT